MMYEGTRDFVIAFIRMCFDPEETVKAQVKQKALPRYLPAFEKVSDVTIIIIVIIIFGLDAYGL